MTQMQTDNRDENYGYLKILDPEIASLLEERGLSYIIENINWGEILYSFEATPELFSLVENIFKESYSSPAVCVQEDTIRF